MAHASLVSVVLLSVSLPVWGVRLLSTDRTRSLPHTESVVEILNSSLANHSEFTVCARIMIYQFKAGNLKD